MEIRQAIIEGTKILKENNIEDSSSIARILLSHILEKSKEYLIANNKEILKDDVLNLYIKNIEKIREGYPLQYITHSQEFMKLNFYVDENVLIPQPDTETLVEKAIEICNVEYNKKHIKVLDLCTGSGAIAISIKKYLDNTQVMGTDISYNALKVANKNAKANNVQINFIQSDMFENINEKFDVIVSNPPYIEKEIIKTLPSDVKHEPIIALDGGSDGLDFYREIAENAYKYLNIDGYLLLEIGYNQRNSVIEILKNENKYASINAIKDLAGNDRVIISKLL